MVLPCQAFPCRPLHLPWVWAYTAIHLQVVMFTITDNPSASHTHHRAAPLLKFSQATCYTFLFSAMLPTVLCCLGLSVCIALSDDMHERCIVDMTGFENVSEKGLPRLFGRWEEEEVWSPKSGGQRLLLESLSKGDKEKNVIMISTHIKGMDVSTKKEKKKRKNNR